MAFEVAKVLLEDGGSVTNFEDFNIKTDFTRRFGLLLESFGYKDYPNLSDNELGKGQESAMLKVQDLILKVVRCRYSDENQNARELDRILSWYNIKGNEHIQHYLSYFFN